MEKKQKKLKIVLASIVQEVKAPIPKTDISNVYFVKMRSIRKVLGFYISSPFMIKKLINVVIKHLLQNVDSTIINRKFMEKKPKKLKTVHARIAKGFIATNTNSKDLCGLFRFFGRRQFLGQRTWKPLVLKFWKGLRGC